MATLSRELLERELAIRDSPQIDRMLVDSSESDLKHLTAYKNFIRFNVVKQKRSQILEDHVFAILGKHLCESPTISYESFKIISSLAPEKARKYFSAKNFLLFPKDANQCIESEDFVR